MHKFMIAILCVACFLPSSSAAEPTMQETVEYINNTIKSCGPHISRPTRYDVGSTPIERVDAVDSIQVGVEDGTITMHESIRWVTVMFEGTGRYSRGFHREQCLKSFDNIPNYARNLMPGRGGCFFQGRQITYVAKGSLAELSVEVELSDGNTLKIKCHGGKKCMKATRKGRHHHYEGEGEREINENASYSANFLVVCNSKVAKLRRAFSHLIKISGGKPDLF